MSNFFSSFLWSFIFFFYLQAFTLVSGVESFEIATQYNIDIEAIMNDDNVANQIDRFLDVGLKCQKSTGVKFNYKKTLKKAFKLLKKNNTKIPKNIKKDIKKRIKKRIEDRFFEKNESLYHLSLSRSSSLRETAVQKYNDPRDKDFYGYTDGLRGGVLEVCTGVALSIVPCGVTQGAGAALIGHGGWRVYEETISYIFSEPNQKNNDSKQDKDGKRPNMADRN